MTPQQHPFEGMVLIPAQQLADIVKVMVCEGIREELDRREAATDAPTELPDPVPAALAANHCGYKSAKPLAKYHGAGLTKLRRGRAIFYAKGEVLKLKKRLFNQ